MFTLSIKGTTTPFSSLSNLTQLYPLHLFKQTNLFAYFQASATNKLFKRKKINFTFCFITH